MPLKTVLATLVAEKYLPDPPGTPGDRLIWTDNVHDEATNPLLGQHSGECVLVREPDVWKCEAGWTFLEGNLVAGGLITFDPNIPTYTTAIYGGTGAYKDARGQITGTSKTALGADLPQGQTRYALEILP
jgi:hypothetical protein